MRYKCFVCVMIMCICLCYSGLSAQVSVSTDSTKAKSNSDLKVYVDLKQYEVAKSADGLFKIYTYKNSNYFEIPDSLLSKDFLCVTRISKGSINGATVIYPGDEINNMVIRFEKLNNAKIVIRKVQYATYSADSTAAMYKAVARSGFLPIIGSFDIKFFRPDSNAYVIDLSAYINSDNEVFSLNGGDKKLLSLSALVPDRSYVQSVVSYPTNIEITAVKTFVSSTNYAGDITINSNASVELNTSLLLLPAVSMQQRFSDARVGYFSLSQVDYDANPSGVKERSYIKRWRLEPKNADDEARYLRGELIEPRKQIVFYIDPATPEKWITYLIAGVNDWNKAFEKAGFKNAIVGKRAPTTIEDPEWSLFDARHSAIVYKPSPVENASGPSIADPRTGEILESHINWYHNVTQLIHDWYMIQCGTTDAAAQRMVFNDTLMGKLIRFVVSHEVGHTLGLLHNFGSSSTVPVDSLRSEGWLTKYGHTPSIMDYARFNYVAQPSDHISENNLMPRINDYDEWAIAWGYKWLPQFKTAEAENHYMSQWIVSQSANPRLWYGPQRSFWDPRCQNEDLGNNAIKAGEYGIENLKRELPLIRKWTYLPDEGYDNLNNIFNGVQKQFVMYLTHIAKNIGGTYETLKQTEQIGPVYQPVPKQHQKQAIQFIAKELFRTPLWLIDTTILSRTGQTSLGLLGYVQRDILMTLIDAPRLQVMKARNEGLEGDKTYTVAELIKDLDESIWTELNVHAKSIDMYRRQLQRIYTFEIFFQLTGSSLNTSVGIPLPISGKTSTGVGSDVLAVLTKYLKDLQKRIRIALSTDIKDNESKAHLDYIDGKIDQFWRALPHNYLF